MSISLIIGVRIRQTIELMPLREGDPNQSNRNLWNLIFVNFSLFFSNHGPHLPKAAPDLFDDLVLYDDDPPLLLFLPPPPLFIFPHFHLFDISESVSLLLFDFVYEKKTLMQQKYVYISLFSLSFLSSSCMGIGIKRKNMCTAHVVVLESIVSVLVTSSSCVVEHI